MIIAVVVAITGLFGLAFFLVGVLQRLANQPDASLNTVCLFSLYASYADYVNVGCPSDSC